MRRSAVLVCFIVLSAGAPVGCGGGDMTDVPGGGGDDAAGAADSRPGIDAGAHPDVAVEVGSGAEAGGNGDDTGASDDGGGSGDSGATGDDAAAEAGTEAGGGGGDGGGGDTGGPFVPAMHPPFPQLQSGGGQVLANPKVVGLFFSDYDNTTPVAAMLNGLPSVQMPDGNNYWSAAVSEYGVGPLTVLPPVMLTQKAPTGSTNPGSLVANEVDTNAGLAMVDSNTVVAVFYPSTTPLSGSCAAQMYGFGGYHMSVMTSKGRIPYAVVSECANFGPVTSALDMVTVAGSHEIIEAVTDPFGNGWPSLDTSTASGWAWDVLLAGNEENGDMCTINAGNGRPSAAYPYLLQRGWSNHAAAAGNLDPCQPDLLPAQPFVGAFPVMPDTVNAAGSTGPGALIAVGASKTVEVDCYSFQATAPFTLAARQAHSIQPPELSFAWDNTSCVNGDKVHLTITVQSKGKNGVEPFILYAKLPGASDPQLPIWASVVAQQ
jgi:hypothetical protein